jgi:hypothetical protein
MISLFPHFSRDSCVQPKKATSPATAPIIAFAQPCTGLKALIPAAPDPPVGDVERVAVAVPDEVAVMTLSLEVAKILRDLISSRDNWDQHPGEERNEKGVGGKVRTVGLVVVRVVINNVGGITSLVSLENRATLLEDRGVASPENLGVRKLSAGKLERGAPNAAELEVDDNFLLGEVRSRITGAGRVTSRWSTKSRSIDAARGQGRRYIRSL